ncbi:MAG: ParA family protein [Gammaproteobacteria bacterium]|jgi:chromosome partitioning protein|nr:ParA family protein [Gammaproteobacteria bacterium]MBT3725584.1 ParA family protein [Gammaproteobacteria bacterium]MBT4075429.1 ParA family protein [Gammaproteobacteria bacterium]MBT4194357.1 ParA family protein [Gammaproteobacteria bacterium]MBT4451985.1 ParA family protein [Gammaproteobacteria bacterium]
MKILAFISHKGGTGKSTLSIHLSVAAEQQGLETLLVDLDSISSTTSEWASVRDQEKPLTITAQLSDVQALCKQAENEGFDLLILDFPPYFSDDVLDALVEVDQALIPISPRFPELQSLSKYIDSIKQNYSLLLNTCTGEEVESIDHMLWENNLPVSTVKISRLEALAEALSHGKGVSEFEPNGKAAGEIQQLLENLIN